MCVSIGDSSDKFSKSWKQSSLERCVFRSGDKLFDFQLRRLLGSNSGWFNWMGNIDIEKKLHEMFHFSKLIQSLSLCSFPAKWQAAFSGHPFDAQNCICTGTIAMQHFTASQCTRFNPFRLHIYSIDVLLCIHKWLLGQHCHDLGTEVSVFTVLILDAN